MTNAITLELTADDLRRAYIVHFRKFGVKGIAAMFLMPACIAALLTAIEGWMGMEHALGLYIGLLVAISAGAFLMRCFSHYWWIPRIARRSYAQQSDMRSPISWRWDDDQIFMGGLYSEARYPWNEFHQWMEADKMLLLYRSEQMFHFLPVTDADTQAAANDIAKRLMQAGITKRSNRQ